MKNNTNKKENTMKNNYTFLNNKFYNTMNNVDSQLYEVSKILSNFDNRLNVEDLVIDVLDKIESSVVSQLKHINNIK